MELSQTMLFRMYQLQIKAQDQGRFVEEGTHNMTISHQNEPGTLAMIASHADKLGTDNYVFELYKNQASYQIHAESPQFKRYGKFASQVLIGRSMTELQLEYRKNPEKSLSITNNDSKLLMFDFSLKSESSEVEKNLITKLKQYNQQTFSQYLARYRDNSLHKLLLIAISDSQNIKIIDQDFRDYLRQITSSLSIQILFIDTLVAQHI